MSITLEHVETPQQDSTTAVRPFAAPASQPRLGLLAVLGEAVRAARALSTADARTSVAVAARFCQRV